MKKTIYFLAVSLLLFVVSLLSSCGETPHEHKYGEWVLSNSGGSTCETKLYFRVCSECENIAWKQGTADDHVFSTYVSNNDATCYKDGTKSAKCQNCDKTDTITDIGTAKHIDSNGTCLACCKFLYTSGLEFTLDTATDTYRVSNYNGTATEVVIPAEYNGKAVTGIGESAFYNCTSLTSVTIGDSVTEIGSSAFYDCSGLTSVTISDSVTEIGSSAFYDCSSLTSVTIGNSVTTIGSSAFIYCSSLTSIVIPDSVTTIGSYAFSDCSSLTSVVIPDSVTTIGERAFYNCKSLTSISVDKGNSAYKDIDGNLYTKDGKTLIQYSIGKTAISFAIPKGVTTIGSDAFCDCYSLTSVVIPDSVTTIGYGAFSYCYILKSIVIPDSVTSIGDYAFEGCSSLTIYCEAKSKPSGWNAYWNSSSRPVVWGYKVSQ